jgi:microcystin degradation protein MlrC
MRAFVGGLFQETNDFSPVPTGLASFAELVWLPAGDSARPPADVNLLGYRGAYERAQERGLVVIPGPYRCAIPAARAGAPTWSALKSEMLESIRAALPLDLVFLFLHGAMAAEGVDDCEGELLAAVRAIVGPRTAVGVVCDLHGNVTAAMVEHADIVAACKEYPHTDFAEESARVLDLLVEQAGERVRPTSVALRVPLFTIAPTTAGPFKNFVTRMRAAERDAEVLSVSAFHGFFGSDHPDAGASIVVTTNDNYDLAQRYAQQLARDFVQSVESIGQLGVGLHEALAIVQLEPGTVVIADRSDNTGGGAGGDSTVILAEMLRRGIENAILGMLWDPVAADFCAMAGEGARLRLRLGGKVGPLSGAPLDVDATVVRVGLDLKQAFFGRGEPDLSMGRSALLRIEGVDVVVSSVRQQVFSRHVFESHGVDLTSYKVIVVKSTQHFYEAFAPLGRVVYCDLPGTCAMDFSALPYRRLTRPIWPLDDGRAEPRLLATRDSKRYD